MGGKSRKDASVESFAHVVGSLGSPDERREGHAAVFMEGVLVVGGAWRTFDTRLWKVGEKI